MLSSLVGALGFFAINTYTRLTAIECGLTDMKVELARMRLIGEEEIRRICRYEIMSYVHNQVNSHGESPILK